MNTNSMNKCKTQNHSLKNLNCMTVKQYKKHFVGVNAEDKQKVKEVNFPTNSIRELNCSLNILRAKENKSH